MERADLIRMYNELKPIIKFFNSGKTNKFFSYATNLRYGAKNPEECPNALAPELRDFINKNCMTEEQVDLFIQIIYSIKDTVKIADINLVKIPPEELEVIKGQL